MRRRTKKPFFDKLTNFIFALSVIAFLIGILPALSTMAAIVYYLFIGIIILATLGLIFMNEGFKNMVENSGDTFGSLAAFVKYSPYILVLSAILALIATIMYAKSPTVFDRKGKIAAGVVFIILPIVAIIVLQFILSKI